MKIEIPVYHDVWMDNGAENLYKLLKNHQDPSYNITISASSANLEIRNLELFKKSLTALIKSKRQNLIVKVKDEKLGTIKEVKKDYILIQEGTKISGRVAFKEEFYNEETTEGIVDEIVDKITKEGNNKCIICGRSFSKPVKKLQQAAYPFATKNKSLSGVRSYKDDESYSFKEYFDDFCPICYLIGIMEWLDDGIVYQTIPGEKSLLFLPNFGNLEDLAKFKDSYRSLLNKNSRYQNIKVSLEGDEVERTFGSFSTLLCFYEKFFINVNRKNIVGNSWALMKIPWGTVKNIKLNTVNIDDSTLQVIDNLFKEKLSIYKDVISNIFFFYNHPKGAPVDWDLTNEIKENLSEAFVCNDFSYFAKNLLPRKGGRVGYSNSTRENLEDFIYLWRLKNMGVPKEKLDTIKGVGNIVAKASKNNPSLIYKLDKTRSIDEFWSILREISRKIVGFDDKISKLIKPSSLEGIIQLTKEHEGQWKEIRDLLVVYSCMYYSIGKKEDEQNE